MTTKKLTPQEITKHNWIIDHKAKRVQHRDEPEVQGDIVQTTSCIVRDHDTGQPIELEILHICELDDGDMVILDETEPW